MRDLLATIVLVFAITSAAAAELGRAPYYTRPVTPAEDLTQLRSEVASGTADEVAWRQRIAIYTSIGELRDAEPMLPLLIEHWPDQPAFREAQMILLSGQGKFVEALAIGEAILQRFPDYPTPGLPYDPRESGARAGCPRRSSLRHQQHDFRDQYRPHSGR